MKSCQCPDSLKMLDLEQIERRLHEAEPRELELTFLRVAAEAVNVVSGAIFVPNEDGDLIPVVNLVENLEVRIPRILPKRAGIAAVTFDSNEPYLCNDTGSDENYTPYLLSVKSIVAVPIRYQFKAIGVVALSSPRLNKFSTTDAALLIEIGAIAGKLLRRQQLDKISRMTTGQPFLIKGMSPAWSEVERRIERAAPTLAPVLVHGESGTGKDLISRAIHFNSKRRNKPYVTVNCAAIPENMLESVLFGHKKGAFTGATYDKQGEFAKADGGTLFLDEVGELPLMLQAKVLRAVEQGEIQQLGSNKPAKRVDVRLVCATNRNLAKMSERGTFRADLYFRLSVVSVTLPPLRDYKDNVPVMAKIFVAQAAERHGLPLPEIEEGVVGALMDYNFPGNVRELKNSIEHAVIMANGGRITAADLPEKFTSVATHRSEPPPSTLRPLREMRESWLAANEKDYLLALLKQTKGNVSAAAKIAEVNRVTFYKLLKKYDVAVEKVASVN